MDVTQENPIENPTTPLQGNEKILKMMVGLLFITFKLHNISIAVEHHYQCKLCKCFVLVATSVFVSHMGLRVLLTCFGWKVSNK